MQNSVILIHVAQHQFTCNFRQTNTFKYNLESNTQEVLLQRERTLADVCASRSRPSAAFLHKFCSSLDSDLGVGATCLMK